MKYIKIITLIVLFTFLTGCSVDANIKINYDYTFDESIKVAFNNQTSAGSKSPETYANNVIKYYKNAIDYKGYSYSFNNGNVQSAVTFTRNSENICEALGNNLFSLYLYDSISCEENDDYYVIQSVGNQKISLPTTQKTFNVTDVNINVELPVSASEDNADEKEGNTYTWKFNENTESDKSIYLKISKDTLQENKTNTIKNIETKKKIKTGVIIFVISIIVIALTVSISIFYKKYKKNKLDY